MNGSLVVLRDRLVAIGRRELDDRTIDPGDAALLVGAIDALEEIAKTPSRNWHLSGRIAREALYGRR